jgi:hypothetical protein
MVVYNKVCTAQHNQQAHKALGKEQGSTPKEKKKKQSLREDQKNI